MSQLHHTAFHSWPLSSFLNRNNTRHRETGPLFVWCDRCDQLFLADMYWVYQLLEVLRRCGHSGEQLARIRIGLLTRVLFWRNQPIYIIKKEVKEASGHLMVYWSAQAPGFFYTHQAKFFVAAAVLLVFIIVGTIVMVRGS